MKRFLLVLLVLVAVAGGGAYWWFNRETPERVVADAARSVVNLKTIRAVRVDLSSTDPKSNVTSGFSFVGQLDLSDLTWPELLGSFRIGAKTTTDMDQTLDLVVSKDRVSFRPRTGTPQIELLAKLLSQDPSGKAFLSVDRTKLATATGFNASTAAGRNAAVRESLQFLVPTLILTSEPKTVVEANGRKAVSVDFRVDRRAVKPFLISLVTSYIGHEPNVDQYRAIDRAVEGLGRGSFHATVDSSTRALTRLNGTWTRVDDQGNELARMGIDIGLAGINEPVSIGNPEGAMDVTSALGSTHQPSLPSSVVRPDAPTNTTSGEVPKFDPSQIDLFQQYSEELKHRSNY